MEAARAPAQRAPRVGDHLVALRRVLLRVGLDKKSPPTEILAAGDVIEVLETAPNSEGQVRLRCTRGWVSLTTQDGDTLMGPQTSAAQPPEQPSAAANGEAVQVQAVLDADAAKAAAELEVRRLQEKLALAHAELDKLKEAGVGASAAALSDAAVQLTAMAVQPIVISPPVQPEAAAAEAPRPASPPKGYISPFERARQHRLGSPLATPAALGPAPRPSSASPKPARPAWNSPSPKRERASPQHTARVRRASPPREVGGSGEKRQVPRPPLRSGSFACASSLRRLFARFVCADEGGPLGQRVVPAPRDPGPRAGGEDGPREGGDRSARLDLNAAQSQRAGAPRFHRRRKRG